MVPRTLARTEYVGGRIEIRIRHQRQEVKRPLCGGRDLLLKGIVERSLRTVPIGPKAVFLRMTIRRVWCRRCNAIQQVKPGIADPSRRYTKAFERYALGLCQLMTIQDVARHLQVS